MWIPTVLIGLWALFVWALYRDRKRKHKIFRKLGIPGPEPHWWYGNIKQLKTKTRISHETFQMWAKEYGNTYGYFEGPTPILVSNDLDLIKQVFIKQFGKFHGRKHYHVQPDPLSDRICSMFVAQGQRWKRLRTILNPNFSSGKIKHSTTMMNRKAEILMNKLKAIAETGEPFNIQQILQQFALDVIGEAAFGIEIDAQSDAHTPLMTLIEGAVDQDFNQLAVFAPIPELRYTLYKGILFLSKFMSLPEIELLAVMEKILKMRREQPQRNPPDLMQLMIDAEASDDHGPLEIAMDDDGDQASDLSKESVDINLSETERSRHAAELAKRKLTTEEIKVQSLFFMYAGFETSSSVLTYCMYALATNPDKQQLLYDEINKNIQDEGDLTYDKINGLLYLDMVLRETLRMYPLGTLATTRRCVESCTINGLTIPEGMVIQPNIWDIHYDPNLWGPIDSKVFEPERFTPDCRAKRHPLAWIPFGVGPRNCMGLRFAWLEMKIVLAKLIKNFRVLKCSQTIIPLKLTESTVIIAPKGGLKIKLQNRN
ncbi:hypothetical protein CAPTEDRAFT_123301 [Capitella teleta]|uniref:Cytochrome P450 n=1 Tax=Capitella teleta TaxID=283909 RepID=R7V8U5_CAPTE|nr:hypothetical protein CAPTEDRAFT_123301 [Capitella teleta]|eukprot:ELU12160.1 hypothetical protein CAPTEDRAFT_123301 [Capitella teleta]